VRSASVINSATRPASAGGKPTLVSESAIRELIARAEIFFARVAT